jgi:hypothetical protein
MCDNWEECAKKCPGPNINSFRRAEENHNAVRAKAYFCGCSITGIAVSNPAEGTDFSILCLLCVVQVAALRRADHSSRVVLPAVS